MGSPGGSVVQNPPVSAGDAGDTGSVFGCFDTLTLGAAYGTVSVFAVSEKAEGVCIRGLKYPLEDHTLTCDYALGVSKERMGEEALISVKRGDLMVMVENV